MPKHCWRESGPASGYNVSGNHGSERPEDDEPSLVQALMLISDHESLETHEYHLNPRARLYSDLVYFYTSRVLTHQNDILRAFTGIYNRLFRTKKRTHDIETTQGIAHDLLPFSLCWECVSERPSKRMLSGNLKFNTWSWASTTGTALNSLFDVPLSAGFVFGPESSSTVFSQRQSDAEEFMSQLPAKPVITTLRDSRTESSHHQTLPVLLDTGELGFWAFCLPYCAYFSAIPAMAYHLLQFKGLPAGHISLDTVGWTDPTELICLTARSQYASLQGIAVVRSTAGNHRIGYFILNNEQIIIDFLRDNERHCNWRFVVLQ